MLIFAGVCTVIMFLFMPETYSPVILQKKVNRLRKEDPVGSKYLYAEHEKQDWSFTGVISRTLFRPVKMLALEPILLLITIYTAVVYGLLYACEFFSIYLHEVASNH
jgi:MFS transporter, DHA1 family, multidrug resistance protein